MEALSEFESDRTGHAKRGLSVFFSPKSVAVIGATEKAGHVGRAILWNLISSPFGGTVYPVNPKRAAVLGNQGLSVYSCRSGACRSGRNSNTCGIRAAGDARMCRMLVLQVP